LAHLKQNLVPHRHTAVRTGARATNALLQPLPGHQAMLCRNAPANKGEKERGGGGGG
jgi:hypothetical protein